MGKLGDSSLFMSSLLNNKHTNQRRQVPLNDEVRMSMRPARSVSEPITWWPSQPHFTSTHTVYIVERTPSLAEPSARILHVKLWIFRKNTGRVYGISVSAKTKDLTHPVRWHWLRCSGLPPIMGREGNRKRWGEKPSFTNPQLKKNLNLSKHLSNFLISCSLSYDPRGESAGERHPAVRCLSWVQGIRVWQFVSLPIMCSAAFV